jgi:large subunit ribosomal protein L18e
MKRTGPSNEELKELIINLYNLSSSENAPLWKRIAFDLQRPSRIRRIVNIYRIQRNSKDNDIVVVPGKVLSDGELDHKVVVAAFKFSGTAKEKIIKAGGKALSIQELMQDNKKGSKIRIIG